MQLNTMDCTGRSNAPERETDLADDMSHELHSDDELRDCDSDEGDHMTRVRSRLNASMTSNGGADISGHEHTGDMQMSQHHHHQFPANHPLNALNNFMGMGGLHGIPSLQHNDVLEKLKMQVRDMKVGLMDQEYAAAHAAAFGANVLSSPINSAFSLPPTTMASFTHAAQTLAAQANNLNSHLSASTPTASTPAAGGCLPNGNHNNSSNFSFTSPTVPNPKDGNPASNSSTSSETSNSSQQNNGWSFEEQYKQVRQLYEINDDPKRKEFLDDLFSFMQKRGTPINRLPIMAKSVLDLYELYNLVIARGGLVDVINKKLWQEIIKGLHLPSSITSAAFTLRTQYMKYLYPYECEKKNLSTPAELQAAIDGNRREGRRSSYGQYEAMHNQMQMPPLGRQALPGGMQQMSPLALVTHAAAANNQQAQAAAAAAAAHHRLMAPTFGQVPNLVTQEIEQRMIEYLKLIQVKKEQNAMANGSAGMGLSPHHQQHQQQHQQQQQQREQQQQQQQQRQRSQSPEISPTEALNALEMSRVALWQMYHNNSSPPASEPKEQITLNNSSEALNLSDSPPGVTTIKREREREPSPDITQRQDFHHQPPPAKRAGFPANFYLPPNMAAAAAAVNFHYKTDNPQDSDAEGEDEHDEEGDHNTTANSSHDDPLERQQLNGMSVRPRHHGSNSSVHNDKSDDSAIENSPSTSAASGGGNEHISPVSTKKIHLSKQHSQHQSCESSDICDGKNSFSAVSSSLNPFDALNLLSGMQFRVTRNGTNENGQQQLVVNLELNGVKYSGLLVANTNNNVPPAVVSPATVSTKDKESNDNINGNIGDLCSRKDNASPAPHLTHNLEKCQAMDTAAAEEHEFTTHDSDTLPAKSKHINPALSNGPNTTVMTS